ncbi:MAG: hypothetical protein ACO3I4_03125 [Candidatus Kapaibacteriota bacterium]
MVRWLCAITLVITGTLSLSAQDDRLDDLSFDESPLQDEVVPYFAVGLGPVFNVAFPNVEDLNAAAQTMGLDALSTSMIQCGAEIFTAVGIVPNLRVGFSWVAGSTQTSKSNVDLGDGVSGTRTMAYTMSNRAIHVDYALVPAKGLAILPGLGFGFGSQTIARYQSDGERSWDDYRPIATSPDAFSELERSTLYLAPRVNVEYAVTPFIALRGQVAYNYQFDASGWLGNRIATVANVPSDISMTALSAQLGVFVGLFN